MLLKALCIIIQPSVNSHSSCSAERPNLGQNRSSLAPCDLEIWWMTLKTNRAPLLCYFKLRASFHGHWWIQTRVTSGNAQIGAKFILTSVTLTFDPWPWPVAWKSLWSIVMIIPENFMMIRWEEHCEKGVTDGRTDGQTDGLKCS